MSGRKQYVPDKSRYIPGEGILRPNTIRCRTGVLERFWAWMEAHQLIPGKLEIRDLERWVSGRLADVTARALITESRHVRSWVRRECSLVAERWKDKLILPSYTSGEPRALTEDEDERIAAKAKGSGGDILTILLDRCVNNINVNDMFIFDKIYTLNYIFHS